LQTCTEWKKRKACKKAAASESEGVVVTKNLLLGEWRAERRGYGRQ
jgi:hypothetical protein